MKQHYGGNRKILRISSKIIMEGNKKSCKNMYPWSQQRQITGKNIASSYKFTSNFTVSSFILISQNLRIIRILLLALQ